MNVQDFQNLVKSTRLQAIKNKDNVEITTQVSVLTYLLADAKKSAKDRKEEMFTQNDLEKSAKKLLKTTQENISLFKKKEENKAYLEKALIEEKTLLNILPKEIDEEELTKTIQATIKEKSLTKDMGGKAIGPIMKNLKDQYGNAFNPQKANALIQKLL